MIGVRMSRKRIAASLAFLGAIWLAGGSTPVVKAPPPPSTRAPSPPPPPTPPVEGTADAQADLLHVFSESFKQAQVSGYTEWGIQSGRYTVRVFDPNAPVGQQAADKSGDQPAVFTTPERMIPAYLGEWVVNYSTGSGTVRDGDTFITTVQNETVTVSEFRTRGGLLMELRDYFHDLVTPVTEFMIVYEVTAEGRRVLAEASGG